MEWQSGPGGERQAGERRGEEGEQLGPVQPRAKALIDLILGRRFFSTLPSLLMIVFLFFY